MQLGWQYTQLQKLSCVWESYSTTEIWKSILINSMDQCPSWEANSSSTSQEVKHIFSNTKSPPLVPVLHQSEKSIHFNSISVKSLLILASYLHPGLPTVLFPSSCPTEILYTFLLPHTCHMTCPSHAPWYEHPNNIWWGVQIIQILIMNFSSLLLFPPASAQVSPSAPYPQIPQPMFMLMRNWVPQSRKQTNYSSVYFNIHVFGQNVARQMILDWMTAGTPPQYFIYS